MKSVEEFRNELYAKYGKRLIIPNDAEYISSKKNIKVICPKHGVKWMRPNNLLNGAKCRDCGYEVVSIKNSDTVQEFLEKAYKVHGNKFEYPLIHEEYGKVNKIHILCKKCGKIFEQAPSQHTHGNGCPICNPFPKKYTLETLKKAIANKHPNIEVVSEYLGDNDSEISVRCTKHGTEWKTTPHRLSQQKHGCKECYHEYRTIEIRKLYSKKFKEFVDVHYKPIYDVSNIEFVNMNTKVKLICPIHGEFFLNPEKMMSRLDGCPYCKESHLEKETRIILDNISIKYEREKTFEWLKNKIVMPIDFYLPQYNVAIECQGEQHVIQRDDSIMNKYDKFENKVYRDKLKLKLCKEQGIPIIYIFSKTHSKDRLNEMFNHMYDEVLFIEDITKNNNILLTRIKCINNIESETLI